MEFEDDTLAGKLRALEERFEATAPGDVAELVSLVARLGSVHDDRCAALLGEVEAMAHRLAGRAAMFDRPALAEAAHALETAARTHGAAGPVDPANLGTFERACHALVSALGNAEQASEGPPPVAPQGEAEAGPLLELFLATHHGQCVLDARECLQNWNPAYARLRGIDERQLARGMPIHEVLLHAKPYAEYAGVANQQFSRALVKPLAERQDTSQLIEQEDGKILRVTGRRLPGGCYALIYDDVTQSERATAALRETAIRLDATFNSVMDGIVTIDDRGKVDSFSRGAEQLFGYAAGEVVGRNVKMLMPGVHSAQHDGYLEAYRSSGQPRIMQTRREVDARRKDGRLVPVELGVSEMRIDGRSIFIGLLRDVTERRRIERLQHEFVATTSHELRNPLASIIGTLGLLRGGQFGALEPRVRQVIDIACRNGERLRRLVDDLLDLERVDSQQFELDLAPMGLRSVAAEALESNNDFAAGFNVRLALEPGPDDPACLLDRRRFHQVLTNLLNNAVKYSGRGSTVTLRVVQRGDEARLSVHDTGIGIPAAFMPHLFERFTRADTSDARHREGAGLGLSIGKALVERMDGRIEVESVERRGSTFTVCLPVRAEGAMLPALAAGRAG